MKTIKTVLLLDDDDISNFIISRMLEKEAFCEKTLIARNGKKGIQILQNCIQNSEPLPDLILLDVNMPVFTGIEFLKYLKNQKIPIHQTNIIAISNKFKEEHLVEMSALGVKGFVTKPVSKTALQEALK